jgi:transcriptional regulator with XRE-family HTH domain
MPFRPDLLGAIREAKGFSQQQLSALAGLSQSIVAKTESGKNSPGSEVLGKLAEALDCTADFLLGRGPEYETPRVAAAHMAFEVARSSLTDEQSEKCRRVLRHPEAPKTAKGWLAFAEMLVLAIEPQAAALALVKRGPKPAAGRRPRRNSGAT